MSSRHTYRRLLSLVGRHRLVFLLAIGAVAADSAGQAAFAYLLQPLVDETIVPANPEVDWVLPMLVLGALLLRIAGNFGGIFGMEWVGRRLVADLRSAIFNRYLVLPARFFDQHSTGQLISRLTYNSEQVAQSVTTALIGAIRDGLTVLFLVTVMLLLSWKLTLSMVLLAPVVALVVTVISRRFRRISRSIQNSMGDVTHVTEETVGGQHVIKVFGGAVQQAEAFERVNDHNRREHLRLAATQLVSSSLIQIAAGLALVLVLVIAASDFMREEVTAGTFMAILMAMVGTIPPLKRLTNVHAVIERGIAAADSLFQVLDEEAEEDRGRVPLPQVRGEVVFEAVDFHYEPDGRRVLEGIDLRLEPGTVTALVGRSGSGKSTLARLLPRLYLPSAGRILLDGVNIQSVALAELREHIAMVSQDVILFNDTVARNIAYGSRHNADREAIKRAAEAAHAMAFIRALPEGLDTPIGPAGTVLSGGQRQRLAIARALLKNAPLLILDEATSALDSESERRIRDALQHLIQDRTTLVIAHRLATVEQADQVVVLDEGRIVEQGTHASLIAQDGLYRHLHRLQFEHAARVEPLAGGSARHPE